MLDLVTLTAISISIASLLIVIVCAVLLRRQVTIEHHNEKESGIEVSAIVSEFGQRLRRLEESLVDQKVKLEVAELRLQRSNVPTQLYPSGKLDLETSEPAVSRVPQVMQTLSGQQEPADNAIRGVGQFPAPIFGSDKRSRNTEHDALWVVQEGKGKTTARDIQQRIGRTREHTARMMNGLFQEGLVDRDVSARPFTYSITQKGLEFLST